MAGNRSEAVIAQVHWWLAAVSFGLGMVLTFTLMARPAKTQMPAWVLAEPSPRPKPEPAMKTPVAEVPTKKLPAVKANSAPAKKKAVSKAPPGSASPSPPMQRQNGSPSPKTLRRKRFRSRVRGR